MDFRTPQVPEAKDQITRGDPANSPLLGPRFSPRSLSHQAVANQHAEHVHVYIRPGSTDGAGSRSSAAMITADVFTPLS
jgi:hypothetical protein